MKYEEGKEICPVPCNVWCVNFTNAEQKLLLMATDVNLESVINFIKVRDKRPFTIGIVDVGEFTVIPSQTQLSYSHDARQVDQDLNWVF